ncbi:hypothetical protein CLM62_16790 [Streptomyces sp. SA15]|uniref:hypothetical protein n=1 Tax=Streptomyces sp. SA15 TaxID=934019 RepID=UPI000BB0164E|nr:hypothetical protein [Streptomyces sp. SA15]PAZ14875.1 hypothetical protein CLM62_16790 [Streptomyces sp. SA15]
MTVRPQRRIVTVCAALALLSACGQSSANDKAAAPLSEQQTKTVVPDAKAMPGWEVTNPPDAYSLEKARSAGPDPCPKELRKGCEGIRYAGSSEFSGTKKPNVSFTAMAYQNEAAAKAAYDVFWASYVKSLAKPEKLDIGALGDRRNAVVGVGGYEGEEAAIAQVRVGTVIVSLTAGVGRSTRLDHALVKKLSAVFADRAREAQAGEKPSAGVDTG